MQRGARRRGEGPSHSRAPAAQGVACELGRQLCLFGGKGVFRVWKEMRRAGTCAFPSIPMLENNRQVPINRRAELAALRVTPVAVWAGLSLAAPGTASFHT